MKLDKTDAMHYNHIHLKFGSKIGSNSVIARV